MYLIGKGDEKLTLPQSVAPGVGIAIDLAVYHPHKLNVVVEVCGELQLTGIIAP